MSVIKVQVAQRVVIHNRPGPISVQAFIDNTALAGEHTGEACKQVIGWYADNWSLFRRVGTTDFTCMEWVKRTFKAPAKALEACLKEVNDKFDNKHETYKHCKTVLGKAAYLGLSLVHLEGEHKGQQKTLAELKKEIKTTGGGETTAEMVIRGCKVIAPVDRDTEELKLSVEEYAAVYDEVDDYQPIHNAITALAMVVGVNRLRQIADQLAADARFGKVEVSE